MTEEEFKKEYSIDGTYTIDEEGLCNVDGNVGLCYRNLKEIPIPFGYVSGEFRCDYNHLTSLKNAPTKVGGTFYCDSNKLTSLKHAPKIVGGSFFCNDNKLTTLEFAPKTVGGDFWGTKYLMRFTEQEVEAVCNVGGNIYVNIIRNKGN